MALQFPRNFPAISPQFPRNFSRLDVTLRVFKHRALFSQVHLVDFPWLSLGMLCICVAPQSVPPNLESRYRPTNDMRGSGSRGAYPLFDSVARSMFGLARRWGPKGPPTARQPDSSTAERSQVLCCQSCHFVQITVGAASAPFGLLGSCSSVLRSLRSTQALFRATGPV